MSAIVAGIIGSLIAAGSERTYDWLRKEIDDVNRESDYSVDLDAVETEFQRALHDQIKKHAGDYLEESLSSAIEPWDIFVHELYGIESASEGIETARSDDIERLTIETEQEAVDRIVDTWITIVEKENDSSIPREPVQKIVVSAYQEAINQFNKEISNTRLADESLLTSIEDLRERLSRIYAETLDTNVYKSLEEFERITTLFGGHPEFIPVAAERETVDMVPESDNIRVSDAREEIINLLDDGIELVSVAGDGGAGKSRLLAAVGKELEKRDTCSVYYVTNSLGQKPLPIERDTVLFIDDVGRKDMEYFLTKAVPEERHASNRDYTVQVVAATRSVYEESLERTVTGLGTTQTRTLWLDKLNQRDISQLIDHLNLQDDTIDQIVERSDGNPFFALLLGKLATEKEGGRLTIKSALSNVVGGMTSSDSDLNQIAEIDSPQAVERSLEALSFWKTYSEPDDAGLITKHVPEFDSPSARRRQFNALAKTGYLEKTNSSSIANSEYSHNYDVLSDYLRLKSIDEGYHFSYIQGLALSEKVSGIAQGIVDLRDSPLTRIYSGINEDLSDLVEWMAEELLDKDIPLNQVLEAEMNLMRVSPEKIPLEDLHNHVKSTDEVIEIGDPVARLTATALNHLESGISIDQSRKWIIQSSRIHDKEGIDTGTYAQTLSHAAQQYGNIRAFNALGDVLELLRQIPPSNAPMQIAGGLANATATYGKEREFTKLEKILSELRDQLDEFPDAGVHRPLAMALMNTAAGYGGSKQFSDATAAIMELQELHDEYPELAVRKQLCIGLANLAADYGDVGSFDDLDGVLEELRSLHNAHKEATIRHELSVGLYNAVTSYGYVARFEEMKLAISELQELHKEYQEAAIRSELADALSESIGYLSATMRFEEVEDLISDLQDLYQEYPTVDMREKGAVGLFNALSGYGDDGRWADMEQILSELSEIHDRHEDQEIRTVLSLGMTRAIDNLSEYKEYEKRDFWLNELRELHEEYPQPENRAQLAGAITSAMKQDLDRGELEPTKKLTVEIIDLVSNHGDLGGFESNEEFLPAYNVILIGLFKQLPELALDLVDALEKISDDGAWLKFQIQLGENINRLHQEKAISTEIYVRVLDRI